MGAFTTTGSEKVRIKQGYAQVGGTRLYYEVAGSGKPLVFIHGFSLDRRMWDDQFYLFAESFRAIRYDARGFGKSPISKNFKYSHVDDLDALLTCLQIEEAIVMGLSMGGWIAAGFALQHPEKTAALVLAEPALSGFEWSNQWNRSMASIETTSRQQGGHAANQEWRQHPIFLSTRGNEELALRLAQMICDYSGWHWNHVDPHRPENPPVIRCLNQIKAPTLILSAEHSLEDFQATANLMRENLPNNHYTQIQGTGHLLNMEAPDAFNQVVAKFLQEH